MSELVQTCSTVRGRPGFDSPSRRAMFCRLWLMIQYLLFPRLGKVIDSGRGLDFENKSRLNRKYTKLDIAPPLTVQNCLNWPKTVRYHIHDSQLKGTHLVVRVFQIYYKCSTWKTLVELKSNKIVCSLLQNHILKINQRVKLYK